MAMPAPDPVHEEQTLPSAEKRFRNQLAAAVRSINWTYAIFWSISTSRPGLLTWNDGFYNGEIKTRKITNSTDLAADDLLLQRSEQLRELYESLLSGECDHRARRPAAALSPEDLGDTEWYYMVCMTYAFRPGQGLPGKSFASSEYVWQCNAQFADSKTFPRALLAKSGAIQTIVCIPFMSGVLELGTTDPVLEDPDMVNRTTTSFWGLQFPRCSEEPGSSSSADDAGEAEIVFEDLDRSAIEAMISGEHEHELGGDDVECLSNGNDLQLQQITKEIDEFYALCEELDVRSLDDNWLVDGSLEVPSSPETAAAGVGADDDVPALNGASRTSCFTAWKGSPDSDDVSAPIAGESQRLLKKTVAGGAWTSNGGGGTARAQESIIKSHVMSERRRREKLNEMFLILKSLIPSVHKVDKASILAETIAYLKELERRVQELESSRELPWPTRPAGGKVSGAKRKAPPEPAAAAAGEEEERHWVLSKDGPSNVNVTIMGMEVLLEVRCRWKELLMAAVFDAIKSLKLDVLSVQASTPDGLLELKVRAQYTGSASVAAGMISEALQKAIGRR